MVEALVVKEMGSVHAVEEVLKKAEEMSPEGQARLREQWGQTPDAQQGLMAAESMFGPKAG